MRDFVLERACLVQEARDESSVSVSGRNIFAFALDEARLSTNCSGFQGELRAFSVVLTLYCRDRRVHINESGEKGKSQRMLLEGLWEYLKPPRLELISRDKTTHVQKPVSEDSSLGARIASHKAII